MVGKQKQEEQVAAGRKEWATYYEALERGKSTVHATGPEEKEATANLYAGSLFSNASNST
jgi:hypothetical protein